MYGYLKNRIKFMMPYTLVQNTNSIFKVLLDGTYLKVGYLKFIEKLNFTNLFMYKLIKNMIFLNIAISKKSSNICEFIFKIKFTKRNLLLSPY